MKVVCKPSNPWSNQVQDFLKYLRKQGFLKAPEPLGFDDK